MKQIFVGSSSHCDAESYARVVFAYIASIDAVRVKPVYWRDAFPLGLVTYEALERMLRICSGAVLVATPEVQGQPNENVMLEFGLVAGRMGITNVVLCRHPEATVPTDLLSLTYIELQPATNSKAATLSESAVDSLRQWALGLPETMEGVPATRIVHGYTGRWKVWLKFDLWRKVPITGGSIVTMEGLIDLNIPPHGKNGFGVATGEILVHLVETGAERKPFDASYKVCADISDVECLPCGEMTLRSHTVSRQRMRIQGDPWPEEGLADEEVGPWNFNWHMSPDPAQRRFKVELETDLINWNSATGELHRDVGPM